MNIVLEELEKNKLLHDYSEYSFEDWVLEFYDTYQNNELNELIEDLNAIYPNFEMPDNLIEALYFCIDDTVLTESENDEFTSLLEGIRSDVKDAVKMVGGVDRIGATQRRRAKKMSRKTNYMNIHNNELNNQRQELRQKLRDIKFNKKEDRQAYRADKQIKKDDIKAMERVAKKSEGNEKLERQQDVANMKKELHNFKSAKVRKETIKNYNNVRYNKAKDEAEEKAKETQEHFNNSDEGKKIMAEREAAAKEKADKEKAKADAKAAREQAKADKKSELDAAADARVQERIKHNQEPAEKPTQVVVNQNPQQTSQTESIDRDSLLSLLSNNGYEVSEANLLDLQEGLSTEKYVILKMPETLTLTESTSKDDVYEALLEANDYEVSNYNKKLLEALIKNNCVLFN